MYRRWTQTDYQNKHYSINQSGYNMYREWTQRDYQNKHYNINQKWLQYVQRMDTNKLPKQALKFKPKVATTCTEDGHKNTTKTRTKM